MTLFDQRRDSFAQAVIKASQGQSDVVEPAYVYLPGIPGGEAIARELGVEYFAVPLRFAKGGAEEAYPVGTLSEYEKQGLAKAVEELRGNVKKGEDFVKA
jgi:malate dehydrogenase